MRDADKVECCGALTFAPCCSWCLLWCLGCLDNEFNCGDHCVALVKRCDRHDDCINGEDEQECSKSNKFSIKLHLLNRLKDLGCKNELERKTFDRLLNFTEITSKVFTFFHALIEDSKIGFKVEQIL